MISTFSSSVDLFDLYLSQINKQFNTNFSRDGISAITIGNNGKETTHVGFSTSKTPFDGRAVYSLVIRNGVVVGQNEIKKIRYPDLDKEIFFDQSQTEQLAQQNDDTITLVGEQDLPVFQ